MRGEIHDTWIVPSGRAEAVTPVGVRSDVLRPRVGVGLGGGGELAAGLGLPPPGPDVGLGDPPPGDPEGPGGPGERDLPGWPPGPGVRPVFCPRWAVGDDFGLRTPNPDGSAVGREL